MIEAVLPSLMTYLSVWWNWSTRQDLALKIGSSNLSTETKSAKINFFQKNRQNIWWFQKKVVPLQQKSNNNDFNPLTGDGT